MQEKDNAELEMPGHNSPWVGGALPLHPRSPEDTRHMQSFQKVFEGVYTKRKRKRKKKKGFCCWRLRFVF